jgi:hypothetical protein
LNSQFAVSAPEGESLCDITQQTAPTICSWNRTRIVVTPHVRVDVESTVVITDLETATVRRVPKVYVNTLRENNPLKWGFFQVDTQTNQTIIPRGAAHGVHLIDKTCPLSLNPGDFDIRDLFIRMSDLPGGQPRVNRAPIPNLQSGLIFWDQTRWQFMGRDISGRIVIGPSQMIFPTSIDYAATPYTGTQAILNPKDELTGNTLYPYNQNLCVVQMMSLQNTYYQWAPSLVTCLNQTYLAFCALVGTPFNGKQCTTTAQVFGEQSQVQGGPSNQVENTGYYFYPFKGANTPVYNLAVGSQMYAQWFFATGFSNVTLITMPSKREEELDQLPVTTTGNYDLTISYDGVLVSSVSSSIFPTIKSIDFKNSRLYMTASSQSSEGSCLTSCYPTLFSAYSVYLKTTPQEFELPQPITQYTGDLNITLTCGTKTVFSIVKVEISDILDVSRQVVVNNDPFNLASSSNSWFSYIWKIASYVAVAASVLLALYIIIRMVLCRKRRRVIPLKMKRY